MSGGISPTLLLSQVENTAAWALAWSPDAAWTRALRNAPSLEADWQLGASRIAYLEILLAAHFATVGTFVPTDVDARIRHHAWQELRGREALAEAVAVVDRTDAWDPRLVSARVVETASGPLSGHDGEWLAVRAGALGRALAVHADDLVDALAARIDAEIEREASAFMAVQNVPGREIDALRVATVLAHNAGDLSRVADEWPVRSDRARQLQARYVRLGHEDPSRLGGAFHLAGHVNKAVMAVENHRFLALRKPRDLRSARELLLPIGPFFDAWGERVGRTERLDRDARASVLGALLEGHESDPSQQGYLRAMAGMHRTTPGGLDALASGVPARLRKLVSGGAVREALRVDPSRFEARLANRYRGAVASYRA